MSLPNADLEQVLGKNATGLATYYNLICDARGYKLPPHLIPPVLALADPRITHLMLIIGPGCLTGDTIIGIERTRFSGLRKITLEELYHKFNGLPWYVPVDKPCEFMISKPWDCSVSTRTLSWCDDRLAMNEIKKVVQSGVKEVYRLKTDNGNVIKASADHPFLVPLECDGADQEGYKKLKDFLPGDKIYIRNNDSYKGGRIKKDTKRAYVYSIQFHPYAYRNVVGGKDYKRLPLARLVIEASMNNMPVDEYIYRLRNDSTSSFYLKFIPPGFDVHHKNEDESDDDLSNLEVLASTDHLAKHSFEKQKNFGNILLKEDSVKSIRYVGKQMTYDIVMNDPHRNFLANDFIVHNSGKSCLLSEVYPSWELGHDPTQTIIGISAGELLVQGFMKSVMEVIEFSPIYHSLFPNVRPDKTAGWSTERGMFVTGRAIGNPDSSYATAGLGSKALTGKHARIIICDDIHDAENSSSTEQCIKVQQLYYSTIIGRADPRGARFILAGRRYNLEDIYGHLKESGDFVVLELPAERKGTDKLWFDITIPDGLDCVFSEQLHKVESERVGRSRLYEPQPNEFFYHT